MTLSITAGGRQIDLSSPVCMGIINTTPDSFSDGAQLQQKASSEFQIDVDKALSRAESMIRDGATFIDIGGESTRPGADEVSTQQQLDRVIPVIQAIRSNLDTCISIDTSSPEVMSEAIGAGAAMVNDIRALSHPHAIEVVKQMPVAICLMHMQGQPGTMQKSIGYDDVVDEVFTFLKERVQVCLDSGISRERLIVDPGFGFGKSQTHNYQLLKNLKRFAKLKLPLLVGISRKSMIGDVVDRPVDQRLAGSIAATIHALSAGANIIRTHDVAATIDAIRVNSALCEV